MKLSARNQIKGTVKSVTEGAVEAQVTLDVGGQEDHVGHHRRGRS